MTRRAFLVLDLDPIPARQTHSEVAMIPDTEIVVRLERLERDNRRLKRLGAAALVLAAALGAIAATQPVPDVIKAHEFDVVDSAGKARIGIDLLEGQPVLTFYDSGGQPALEMADWDALGPSIMVGIHDTTQAGIVQPGVEIRDQPAKGPRISLSDTRGFRLDLGSTDTETSETGQTQHTSAASIIMFGNDKKHHAIWRAP